MQSAIDYDVTNQRVFAARNTPDREKEKQNQPDELFAPHVRLVVVSVLFEDEQFAELVAFYQMNFNTQTLPDVLRAAAAKDKTVLLWVERWFYAPPPLAKGEHKGDLPDTR